MLRIREHQQIEADQQQQQALTEPGATARTDWLSPDVTLLLIPKGVQMRWSFAITDPNQVSNGYWIIDESALKKAVADGVCEIPGVRIYEEAVTTFRR